MVRKIYRCGFVGVRYEANDQLRRACNQIVHININRSRIACVIVYVEEGWKEEEEEEEEEEEGRKQ